MDADELRRVLGALRERRDRQGRGVGAEDDVGHHRLRLGGGLGLHLAILEHRLDDEVDAGQRAVIGGRGDARQHGVALRRGGAALVDLVGQALLDMRLALVGALLVAVDQHDVEAGLRADRGDAGAHEARAEDADLLDLRLRHVRRPPRALVELLHRDEQRADHRRRLRRAQDLGEIARLHGERAIHRQLQALVHHLQDGARGRIVVVGLAAVDRVRRRERHHAGPRIDRPARQAEAVDVPRRLGLAVGLDPVLGGLDEIGGRHHGIDELHRLGAVEPELVALEQELQRVGGRHHARDALGAAGAGKQADLDLGQADAGLVVVGGDALVAGEAELEAAAERGAVDGGDERLAAGLDAPVELRQLAALGEQHRRRGLLALALGQVAERARQRFQQRQVGAGAERLLARGDDRALDRGVGRDLLDDRGQFLDRREIDDVHRAPRHVPGDERDAVGIDVELEIVGHRFSPAAAPPYSLIGSPDLRIQRRPLSSRSMRKSTSG